MADRPNIIFILTDQHRLSGISAYGETPCRTPNIDRLANEGVLFKNAYTVYPVCSPARGTLQTGVYPHTHGITSNTHEVGCSVHELEDRPELLPRRLLAAGYGAGFTGKWHLGSEKTSTFQGSNKPSSPSRIGYEGQDFAGHGGAGQAYPAYLEWLHSKGHKLGVKPWNEPTTMIRNGIGELTVPTEATVPAYLVDNVIEMAQSFTGRNLPYFVSLNFWGPHGPYLATKEFLDWYADVVIPPWPNYEWPSRDIPGPHHLKIHWDHESLTWNDWAMAVKYYYARVSMIDSQIGRLYNWLEKSGELENTVLIFTADHGETLGSHGGLLDKGWHHFEETHHVPLIIRFPDGSHAGKRVAEFASIADMYPTILDFAGGDYDQNKIHGTSLLPLINGETTNWRDCVVTEFLGLGNVATSMKMLRMGNLKYGCNLTGQDELYDLEKDPHEMNNLIDDPEYVDDVKMLKVKLKKWMQETDDPALRMYQWREREGIV